MRKAFLGLAVAAMCGGAWLAIPTSSVSSPGGLDARGGHHCWTKCSRYGLRTGQFHCHRKPCNSRDIRKHRRHGH